MAPKIESDSWKDTQANLTTAQNDEDAIHEKAAAGANNNDYLDAVEQNQVLIDGGIFSLDSFDHPGGDAIRLFGGNDVTVIYRMIHPRHSSKHYAKVMQQVGTVKGYQNEYKFESAFEKELKREVFKIVRPGTELGTPGYLVRACCYLALYFVLQYFWVTEGSSYWLALFYGMSCGLIGLNVQHDANHGAASKKTWVNDLLGFGADLIGGNKWIWMEKHWTHHAYTNHKDKDPDGIAAEPLILFNHYPKGHPSRKWWHPFQAALFLPILAGYWLSSMLSLDIVLLIDGNAESVGMKYDNAFTQTRRKYSMLSRAIYMLIHIGVPIWHHGVAWKTLGHVMTFGAAGSLTLGLLFVLSHNFEEVDRDPTVEARQKGERICWYKSQVETSSTYGGFIAGALTGGLNFQIEHHLFPRMCSAYYPYIAPTVREVCKKHGVHYTYYPWFLQNFISTMKYVHLTGMGYYLNSTNKKAQ